MKIKNLTLLLLLSAALSSCIKDEALNSEADILTAEIPNAEILKVAPNVENSKVTFWVKSNADVTQLAPVFTLTPGAVISPASSTVRDFTEPQTYTVMSEDGDWEKEYIVTFSKSNLSVNFNFSKYEVNPDGGANYYIFYEEDEYGRKYYPWASANSAFSLSITGEKTPSKYPTSAAEGEGSYGSALKLTTKSTGSFGSLVGKPIAAGSLFLGTFDSKTALAKPLESVHLGFPFNSVPDSLFFRYKYKSGTEHFVNGKKVEASEGLKPDMFDTYAVLFENKVDGEDIYLDGTNRFTHPNIIAIARIDENDATETNEWRAIKVPFVYQEGKTIDPTKLLDDMYSISVVMSSSALGDYFTGALESTLLIDELEIILKK